MRPVRQDGNVSSAGALITDASRHVSPYKRTCLRFTSTETNELDTPRAKSFSHLASPQPRLRPKNSCYAIHATARFPAQGWIAQLLPPAVLQPYSHHDSQSSVRGPDISTLREIVMVPIAGHGYPVPLCRDACLLEWLPSLVDSFLGTSCVVSSLLCRHDSIVACLLGRNREALGTGPAWRFGRRLVPDPIELGWASTRASHAITVPESHLTSHLPSVAARVGSPTVNYNRGGGGQSWVARQHHPAPSKIHSCSDSHEPKLHSQPHILGTVFLGNPPVSAWVPASDVSLARPADQATYPTPLPAPYSPSGRTYPLLATKYLPIWSITLCMPHRRARRGKAAEQGLAQAGGLKSSGSGVSQVYTWKEEVPTHPELTSVPRKAQCSIIEVTKPSNAGPKKNPVLAGTTASPSSKGGRSLAPPTNCYGHKGYAYRTNWRPGCLTTSIALGVYIENSFFTTCVMEWSNEIPTDMHFTYGEMTCNASAACHRYTGKFPARHLPDARAFTSGHRRLDDELSQLVQDEPLNLREDILYMHNCVPKHLSCTARQYMDALPAKASRTGPVNDENELAGAFSRLSAANRVNSWLPNMRLTPQPGDELLRGPQPTATVYKEQPRSKQRLLEQYSKMAKIPHYSTPSEDHGGWTVSLLTSHQGKQGSIPGRVTPEFSHVGIVPDDAFGRWVLSGISRSSHPFIPALPHTHLSHPHRLSKDLAVKSRLNLFSLIHYKRNDIRQATWSPLGTTGYKCNGALARSNFSVDIRALLVPWILTVIITMLLDLSHIIYLFALNTRASDKDATATHIERAIVATQTDPVQSVAKFYIVPVSVIVPNTAPSGRELRWRFADTFNKLLLLQCVLYSSPGLDTDTARQFAALCSIYRSPSRGRGDVVVRLLVSHLGEPGSVPGGIAHLLSQVGIMPDDTAGRPVFSALSFRCWTILTSLHHHRLSRPQISPQSTYRSHASLTQTPA
ncbi:hypothetical protein PR048_006136 [Dryococelus australis]|uniref:Uncharacterized protein n=1 Tax=Dryococelus australis TaxID=614101 RepID=A0ABQ9IA43_9NEOP|nr:hypothetical protein PR048_006136 [Dryococelus australis]